MPEIPMTVAHRYCTHCGARMAHGHWQPSGYSAATGEIMLWLRRSDCSRMGLLSGFMGEIHDSFTETTDDVARVSEDKDGR